MTSDRRDRLIRAARQLFVERGFRAAGIDAILELAGVAKMTLYNHFGSKDALIREVLNHHDVESRTACQLAMSDADGSARDALLVAFERLGAEIASEQFDGGLFVRAAYEFAGEGDVYRNAASEHGKRVCSLFVPYLVELGVDDPAETAERLVMLLDAARTAAFARGDAEAARRATSLAALVIDDAA